MRSLRHRFRPMPSSLPSEEEAPEGRLRLALGLGSLCLLASMVAAPARAGDGRGDSLTGRSVGQPVPEEAALVLRWSTATEFERHGYHVYRALSAEGPFDRLTDEPIPAAGTTDVPQHYRFADPSAQPGAVYYYFVESVSTRGERTRLTPVRAFEARTPAAGEDGE